MKSKTVKILFTWLLFLSISMMLTMFIHESGHGFGATLDGRHVSSGFHQVGDVNRKPSDANFRSEQLENGMLDSSSLLGPLSNWLLAIIFTLILIKKHNNKTTNLFIGSIAVASIMNRFFDLIIFFISALFHKVFLPDEIEWGMRSVKGLQFPMKFDELKSLTKLKPMIFLSEPRIYFWPLVSLTILSICLFISYKYLYKLFRINLPSKFSCILFGIMPILAIILTSYPIIVLDNLIRINW